jgi:hypothetical protein
VVGVDQFVRSRRHAGKDSKPSKRIHALVHAKHAGRNRRPANAVKAVAPGNEIAFQFFDGSSVLEANLGICVDVMNASGFGLEEDPPSSAKPRRDQILDHFMLRVDGDGLAASQLRQIDAMANTAEAQLDAAVHQTFALQPAADAGLSEQIHGPLFENAGPDALLRVFAAAALEDDRVNSLQMEQVRERQSGGTCADDSDLGSHSLIAQKKRFTAARRVPAHAARRCYYNDSQRVEGQPWK